MLNWRSNGKLRSRPGLMTLSSVCPLARNRQQTMTFGTMKVAKLMRLGLRNLRTSFERLKLLSSFLIRVQLLDSGRQLNITWGFVLATLGAYCCTYNYLITQSSEIKLSLLMNISDVYDSFERRLESQCQVWSPPHPLNSTQRCEKISAWPPD